MTREQPRRSDSSCVAHLQGGVARGWGQAAKPEPPPPATAAAAPRAASPAGARESRRRAIAREEENGAGEDGAAVFSSFSSFSSAARVDVKPLVCDGGFVLETRGRHVRGTHAQRGGHLVDLLANPKNAAQWRVVAQGARGAVGAPMERNGMVPAQLHDRSLK